MLNEIQSITNEEIIYREKIGGISHTPTIIFLPLIYRHINSHVWFYDLTIFSYSICFLLSPTFFFFLLSPHSFFFLPFLHSLPFSLFTFLSSLLSIFLSLPSFSSFHSLILFSSLLPPLSFFLFLSHWNSWWFHLFYIIT